MCVGGFHFSLKYLYQVRRQSMCVGGFRLDFVTILEGFGIFVLLLILFML